MARRVASKDVSYLELASIRHIRVEERVVEQVTQILNRLVAGETDVAARLLPMVYEELRRLAMHRLKREKPGHTLQPTALVHEAYVRLVAEPDQATGKERHWENKGHFFAAAAEAMRRILVESARRKSRTKHGGAMQRVNLEEHDVPVKATPEEILALDDALTKLAAEEPSAARIVQLHFFAGLPIEQAAEALQISRAAAYREWTYARAWLKEAIGGDGPKW